MSACRLSAQALLLQCPRRTSQGLSAIPSSASLRHYSSSRGSLHVFGRHFAGFSPSIPGLHTGELQQQSASASSEPPGSNEDQVPTPTLPSGPMMAQFLLAYKRMLEHETPTGDSAAQYGESVLERVRVGLEGLLHHPQHGAYAGALWRGEEAQVEECLEALQEDVRMFRECHGGSSPSATLVELAVEHCEDAARLLTHL